MYTPQRIRNKARARTATLFPIPAPVGGWNARDPITSMQPGDAVVLDNWFPMTSKVVMRGGMATSATGIAGDVQTLIGYRPPASANQKLFAFAGTHAYDASAAGAVGAAVLSGLTNALWQCTNFSNSAGNFLLCVNGADDMRTYDGSTWNTINSGSTPAITGVLTSSLIHVNIFKERPFYIEKNSLSVWYPAVQAFAGALTKFTLASVVKKGGHLVAMGNWSVRGGQTIDDLAVFITSEGECAVYQGTDPASPTTWALVGVYMVGKPIGSRCFLKLGGDLLILTTDGVVPATQAFPTERSDQSVAITDKIQGAMAAAVQLYGNLPGWEMKLFPERNALVLSVPAGAGTQVQYVMNTITKSWCRFTGWPAICFESFNGQLFLGMTNEVRQAWTGTADVADDITAELVTSFSLCEYPGLKSFLLVQPLIAWDYNPAAVYLSVDVDYDVQPPPDVITLPQSTIPAAHWDSSNWDAAAWGGNVQIQRDWYSVGAEGIAAAAHLIVQSGQANIEVSAFNASFGRGGQMG